MVWEGRLFVVLAFSPEERGNTFGSCRAATATTAYKEDLKHCIVLNSRDLTRMVFAGLRMTRNDPPFPAVSKSARCLKVLMVGWD